MSPIAYATNTITIAGRLTRDPELKFTASGRAMCSLSVAQNDSRQDEAGQWVNGDPSFFNVTAWNALAERCADVLHKGDPVMVTGRLKQRSWENEAGEKRSTYNVMADVVAPDLRYIDAQLSSPRRVTDTRQAAAPPAQNYDYADDEPF